MYEAALKEARTHNYHIGIAAKILNAAQAILLIKRSYNDNFSGIWEIPGGAVEKGETLEHALTREVMEETGLKIERINKFIKYFDFYNIETRKTTRKFCFEAQTSGEVQISFEHQNYKWFTQEEIQTLKIQGQSKTYDIWRDHYGVIIKV